MVWTKEDKNIDEDEPLIGDGGDTHQNEKSGEILEDRGIH